MDSEIEAKFVQINIEDTRARLEQVGATLKVPMRLMRRVAIDSEYMQTGKDAYLRVRDEGDKVTMTYKQYDSLTVDGAKEIEVVVSNYDDTVELLRQTGLVSRTYQETRRETWYFDDVEIVIDEWPWLDPYIEIEGASEIAIKDVADKLGFDWSNAVFGDVMAAYRVQYPHLSLKDTVAMVPKVTFHAPLPDLLKKT